MRVRGLVFGLGVIAAPPAAAQPPEPVSAEASAVAVEAPPLEGLVQLGHGALPGGLHAPSARVLPRGTFTVASLGGFGWRSGLLPTTGADHRFGRGLGNLALAYAVTDALSVGLALDGRYDRHFGVPPASDGGTEDGYVGDPRLLVRAAQPVGTLQLGAQLGVWVPGRDAPSVAASAISVEGRALLGLPVGPGSLTVNAGFRLDRSAESIANPATLSLADRVSLGVSDFHAVLGGAHLAIPAGRAYFGVEASTELFLGDGAPGPIVRAGAQGGIHVTPQWSVLAFAEYARVPGIEAADVMANAIPLIAYEPAITAGLGVQARFGGRARGDAHVTRNAEAVDVAVIAYADVRGTVLDDAGRPVAGAKVTVRLANHTGTGATDDQGAFVVARLPIGKTVRGETTLDDTGAAVTIEVDGKKPVTQTLTLTQGANAVAGLTLEPELPPGQLRAVLRAAGTGKPIAGATVTIEPGGTTATAAADGTISIDLVPGTYKARATAPGFKEQTLDVVIDPNGVSVKNFELRK